jgi:hypothetical protein
MRTSVREKRGACHGRRDYRRVWTHQNECAGRQRLGRHETKPRRLSCWQNQYDDERTHLPPNTPCTGRRWRGP